MYGDWIVTFVRLVNNIQYLYNMQKNTYYRPKSLLLLKYKIVIYYINENGFIIISKS